MVRAKRQKEDLAFESGRDKSQTGGNIEIDVPARTGRRMAFYVFFGLVALLAALMSHPLFDATLHVSNAYGARIGCSVVFVANRTLESALASELKFPPIAYLSQLTVDRDTHCVTAQSRLSSSAASSVACWRGPRLGCALGGPFAVDARMLQVPVNDAWPLGEKSHRRTARKDMDVARVWSAVEAHFAATSLQARAFVVVRNGELLMEHYADGFDASTPLLGWSMTKSLMHALLAVRSKDAPALLNLTSPVDLPEWVGDAKSQKTVRDFLQMRSGMSFDEYYTPGSDVLEMLFKRSSTWGQEMVDRPLRDAESAACFQYSSTTTNILARLLKLSFERDGLPDAAARYEALPHRLFDALGMHSAVLEADGDGTFVGSSFSWATARDWAKLGQLYLQGGVWQGEALLPAEWVADATEPSPTSDGYYGSHWWLGGRGPEQDIPARCDELFPSRQSVPRGWLRALPTGTFLAHGFEEQTVMVVPSKGVVIVRLGCTPFAGVTWDKAAFYSDLLDALPDIN